MTDTSPDISTPGRAKRVYSSSTEDSDNSLCVERRDRQERKRQYPGKKDSEDRPTVFEMDLQAVLDKIDKRFDTLATKEDLDRLTATFMEKIQAVEGRLFEVEAQREKAEEELRQMRKKNETLQNVVKHQESRIKVLEKEQNDLEQYSRRNHLRVFKVPEQPEESATDCIKKVCAIFSDSVGVPTKPCNIEVAHRVGRRSSSKPRPILVRFMDRKIRDQILTNRRKLKGKGVSIGEDLTVANFQLLKKAMAHSATMTAWSVNGKVVVKAKNNVTIRVNIHTDLDEALKRAVSTGDVSGEE